MIPMGVASISMSVPMGKMTAVRGPLVFNMNLAIPAFAHPDTKGMGRFVKKTLSAKLLTSAPLIQNVSIVRKSWHMSD